MPRPAYRTHSLKRVFVATPSGETKVHYEKRKPGPARCAICKRRLHGVPTARSYVLRNLPRTAKRPERPYGGVLCSACLAKLIKSVVRGQAG